MAWDQRQFELRTEPGAERVERSFGFRNDGGAAVMVTSVESSCGCTTAELAQTVYGPGEAGRIDVTFELGDRKGRQIKKVVRTDDPATPVTTLTLDVTIPRPVELTPFPLSPSASPLTPDNVLQVELTPVPSPYRLVYWKRYRPLKLEAFEVVLNRVGPTCLAGR